MKDIYFGVQCTLNGKVGYFLTDSEYEEAVENASIVNEFKELSNSIHAKLNGTKIDSNSNIPVAKGVKA